jgi:hypothetical protein
MTRIPKLLLTGIALTFLCGSLLRADGAIRGTVTNEQGQAVSAATITLDGPQGVRTLTAANDGSFALHGLPYGFYLIRVTKGGFSDTLNLGVMIQNDHIFRLNCQLTGEGQVYAYRRVPIDTYNATPVVRAGSIVYF